MKWSCSYLGRPTCTNVHVYHQGQGSKFLQYVYTLAVFCTGLHSLGNDDIVIIL